MHDTLEGSVVDNATIHAGAIVQASSDAYRPTEAMKPLSVAAPAERGDLVMGNIYQTAAAKDYALLQTKDSGTKSDSSFSVQQLANLTDRGFGQHDLKLAADFTFEQVQRSFDHGGNTEAQKMVDDLNTAIKTDGVGPLIRNENGKLSMHMVQEQNTAPTAEQMRSGAYFQVGTRYFHDLTPPQELNQTTWQNAEHQRINSENAERTGAVTSAADILTNDAQFAKTGQLSESTAREFASQLGRHDGEMPAFIGAVNAELQRRGSKVAFTVEVTPNQPGMHGNTVTMYNIQSFNRTTGAPVQAYRDGHDTVRAIGGLPTFQWDKR
ncbi:MAG: hypothetical protein KGS72_28095 [Cyanobacteria bacterium REEB67]|nr:hypothetical protein [Cyanobacteria bacterium REEB67]